MPTSHLKNHLQFVNLEKAKEGSCAIYGGPVGFVTSAQPPPSRDNRSSRRRACISSTAIDPCPARNRLLSIQPHPIVSSPRPPCAITPLASCYVCTYALIAPNEVLHTKQGRCLTRGEWLCTAPPQSKTILRMNHPHSTCSISLYAPRSDAIFSSSFVQATHSLATSNLHTL